MHIRRHCQRPPCVAGSTRSSGPGPDRAKAPTPVHRARRPQRGTASRGYSRPPKPTSSLQYAAASGAGRGQALCRGWAAFASACCGAWLEPSWQRNSRSERAAIHLGGSYRGMAAPAQPNGGYHLEVGHGRSYRGIQVVMRYPAPSTPTILPMIIPETATKSSRKMSSAPKIFSPPTIPDGPEDLTTSVAIIYNPAEVDVPGCTVAGRGRVISGLG